MPKGNFITAKVSALAFLFHYDLNGQLLKQGFNLPKNVKILLKLDVVNSLFFDKRVRLLKVSSFGGGGRSIIG
jgi:hypothetical protein